MTICTLAIDEIGWGLFRIWQAKAETSALLSEPWAAWDRSGTFKESGGAAALQP